MSEEHESFADESMAAEIDKAELLAKSLTANDVKEGGWFFRLLTQVVRAYNRNARAAYFQQKYPGLSTDILSDKIISVASRYAAVTGGIAGAISTFNILALPPAILGEIMSSAAIQMRLVLDLSVIYDLQLNVDDPEDILMIFGYALGITPTDIVGKGLQSAGGAVTKQAIREYVSKDTLVAVQAFGRSLGVKILQRDIIKFAVPAVSVAIGSSYNYLITASVGKIAKEHFRNRGKVTEELRSLLSRQSYYHLVFPAALLYIARVDGEFVHQERELYQAMLSRMSFDEHVQADYQRILASEENILQAINQLEDPLLAKTLLDALMLMAVCDGRLADEESVFLQSVAEQLHIEIDLTLVEEQTRDYRASVSKSYFQKSKTMTKNFVGSLKSNAQMTGSNVKNAAGKVTNRNSQNVSTDAEKDTP
jgi:hypothetical protein